MQHAADLGGWTRFVSMQNQYNLLRRQDERELMAMCGDLGVGLVPYPPERQRPPGRRAKPIVGAARPHHLGEAVAALDIHLTGDEAAALERPYVDSGPSWH